jgi:hypothetical protein
VHLKFDADVEGWVAVSDCWPEEPIRNRRSGDQEGRHKVKSSRAFGFKVRATNFLLTSWSPV